MPCPDCNTHAEETWYTFYRRLGGTQLKSVHVQMLVYHNKINYVTHTYMR
jgi:hypothetical protein